MRYWHRFWLLLSQAINALLLNGDPDESLSARAYRQEWTKTRKVIDLFLGAGHCNRVWQRQRARERARWR